MRSFMRQRRALAALAFLLVFRSVASAGTGHAADVDAFAGIMADVRTASERCPDLVIDWTAVAKEKDRLHIEDVDYFGFRKRAHDLADGLEERLAGGEVGTWCDEVFRRYGPEGRSVTGLVRR